MVDSVLPDKSCKVLYEELTHEKWGENDSKNFADSDDSHILLNGGHNKMLWGEFQKLQYDYPTIKHKTVQEGLERLTKSS